MVRIRLAILLFAGWCVLCGCQREASIPSDNFRLTVQEVVSESDVSVSLLTIRLSRRASISVDGDGFHSHVVLPDAQDGVVRKGEMAVSEARVAPSQDKFAYVQHAMSNANQPLPYTDDVETIPADEAKDIERVVQAMKLLLARTQTKSGEFRADVHVKPHGYVQGELRVLPDLPAELAQGLFERESVFRTVVRFSNAASEPHADAIPDGRGMAIKVLGMTGDVVSADEQGGPTQDFLMINHPVFFARNAKDFLRLE